MSKGRFLEGVIIGTALGVLGTLFLIKEESIEENNVTESGLEKKTKTTKRKINKESVDILVSKSVDTLEMGLVKLLKILDEIKSTQSSNTKKVKK